MERNKYLRETRTERLRVHIMELLQEKIKLEEKKQRATKLIAELKKENQELQQTIYLMMENDAYRNRYFKQRIAYYKEHIDVDIFDVLNKNKTLETDFARLRHDYDLLNESHKKLVSCCDHLILSYSRGEEE